MGIAIELLATRLLPVLVGLWQLAGTKAARATGLAILHGIAAVPRFLVGVIRHGSIQQIEGDARRAMHRTGAEVSRHAATNTGPVAKYMHGVAHRTRAVNEAQAHFAEVTASSVYRLRHNVMPHAIRVQVRPVRHRAQVAQHTADIALQRWKAEKRSRERSISHIRKKWLIPLGLAFAGIDAYVKRPHAHAHHKAHVQTIPRTVRQVRAHGRRIARIERAITRAAIAAAVGVAIARIMPSWRCSNFRNFARKLRCSHWKWLDDLLFGALALIAVVDPVALARAAVRVEDTLEAVIREIAD